MFGLGFTEIIAIGAILFVFFGAKKLPLLGSSLAQGIRNFQKGLKSDQDLSKLEDSKEQEDLEKENQDQP